MICRHNICFILAILILGISFFFGLAKGKGFQGTEYKRGYLLDRRGEPLVVNKESFQAYLLLRGRSILGEDVPQEVKPYLSRIVDLPQKGFILISESLTMDEVKRLRNVRDIIIRGNVERKILFRELKPLIGIVSNGEGISGLEKVFNEQLKQGNSIVLSLDTNLVARADFILKKYSGSLKLKGLALFKLSTGELMSFATLDEKNWLINPFLILKGAEENIPEKVKWELGEIKINEEGKYIRITPLHIVKSYISQVCDPSLELTLLPQWEERCAISDKEADDLFLYLPDSGRWFYFIPERGYLYLLTGQMNLPLKEDLSWENFKKSLRNLKDLIKV